MIIKPIPQASANVDLTGYLTIDSFDVLSITPAKCTLIDEVYHYYVQPDDMMRYHDCQVNGAIIHLPTGANYFDMQQPMFLFSGRQEGECTIRAEGLIYFGAASSAADFEIASTDNGIYVFIFKGNNELGANWYVGHAGDDRVYRIADAGPATVTLQAAAEPDTPDAGTAAIFYTDDGTRQTVGIKFSNGESVILIDRLI